jgi:hypothetical protein
MQFQGYHDLLKEGKMKTVLAIVVAVVITGILGFLLGPILIQRELAPLKGEVAQLQKRLQASEDFIKAEEEARQRTGLKADTKFPDVVKTVNRLAAGQKSIEDIMQVRFADFDARLAEMKAATGGGMNKLSQQIEDGTKKTDQRFQDNALRAKVEDARIRLVKVKSELLARNVGVAKGELDLLSQTLEGAKKLVRDDGNKKTAIERLQGMVKEIKAEMDGNLVAATDRIDLLWHELAKLSNDG